MQALLLTQTDQETKLLHLREVPRGTGGLMRNVSRSSQKGKSVHNEKQHKILREVRKPKPFVLSRHNYLEVCDAINDPEGPLRPHIWGTLDYVTMRDLYALDKWLQEAAIWLRHKNKPKAASKYR